MAIIPRRIAQRVLELDRYLLSLGLGARYVYVSFAILGGLLIPLIWLHIELAWIFLGLAWLIFGWRYVRNKRGSD